MASSIAASTLLQLVACVLLGAAAASADAGDIMAWTSSVAKVGAAGVPAASATQRITACPKPKPCPKPKACPKPKTCPRGSGITCANFRSTRACRPYNTGTIDASRVTARGDQRSSNSANAPPGATLGRIANYVVLPGNLGVYAFVPGYDSNGSVYAVTLGSSVTAAGCKIATAAASVFNNALVLEVTISCSGRYLVAP